METATYQIPEENLAELTKKMSKLARKATKLNVGTASFEVGGFEDRVYYRNKSGDRVAYVEGKDSKLDSMVLNHTLPTEYVRFYSVTVTGETPRLNGWEFIGTLMHLADDQGNVINMLRTVPSFKGQLPERFRTASPENCDHCHKVIRTRKETFVVRSEAGEFKQVGRNCTQDFLGGQDPTQVANLLQILLDLNAACEQNEESMGGGSGGATRHGMLSFLSAVALMVRIEGWTSRGKARASDGQLTATADMAMEYLTPPTSSEARAKWAAWVAANPITAEDIETAEKASDYAHNELAARDTRSDYEHNLYVATVQATVDYRLTGIVASLVPYYLREVERQVIRENEMAQAKNSEYIGTVGEKVVLTVTCAKIITCETQFGTSFLHRLITLEGCVVVWFSSNAENNLKPGVTTLIKATVKKHDIRQNVKQTVVTRLVTTTQEEVDAEAAKAVKKAARAAKKNSTKAVAA